MQNGIYRRGGGVVEKEDVRKVGRRAKQTKKRERERE